MRYLLAAVSMLAVADALADPQHEQTVQIAEADFEPAAAGEMTHWVTAGGVWHAAPGEASVAAGHGRGGGKALHLTGGESSSIQWIPDLADAAPAELTFWAQRWTRADPFAFTVEAEIDGRLRTLYRGDSEVPVGRYRKFTVPWPAGEVRWLRFTATGPPNKGALLDDVSIDRAVAMRIAHVVAERRVTPVLIGSQYSPLARLTLTATGNRQARKVQRVRISLDGTSHPDEIAHLELRYSGSAAEPDFRDSERFFAQAKPLGGPLAPSEALEFEGEIELADGRNTFWLTAALHRRADLDGQIMATVEEVITDDGQRHRPEAAGSSGGQRIGVALRHSGQDGVVSYRIPALVTTNTGTLIAVYDVRHDGWGDLPGNIDVGMSRSTDGGRSWEPMRIIMDMGNEPRWMSDGVGDPSALVDHSTNTIWIAGLWSHGDRGFHTSGPGLGPEETAQLLLVRSDDDGASWSAPINITAQVKDPAWRLLLQGPGRGITTRSGTLVFPAQFVDADGMPHATLIYSRDQGETWHVGTSARSDTTEAQVVELADGSLMLNMRDNRGGSRAVAVTDDLGQSWQTHPTSRQTLPEPVCQASLITIAAAGSTAGRDDKPDWLVFSNPAVSQPPRRNMTIRGSHDQGMSWPHRLLIDEGVSAGYSCLTLIDEQTLGFLYEGSLANMTFMRVRVAELFAAEALDR